jgi:indole-3-glycerol phosphate synthase
VRAALQVHSVAELQRVLSLPNLSTCMLGINNRDLGTFKVDLHNTEHIMQSAPGQEVREERQLCSASEARRAAMGPVAARRRGPACRECGCSSAAVLPLPGPHHHAPARHAQVVSRGLLMAGESGIFTPEDVALVAAAGCGAILVGESLVKQGDPAQGVRDLLRKT